MAVKRMSDDEITDYTYNKIFGDLDGMRSGSQFSKEEAGSQTVGLEGINITVKPIMAGEEVPEEEEEEIQPEPEPKDALKGIGKMSPLMSQLHGER